MWVWLSEAMIELGSFAYVWKNFHGPYNQIHKLAPITERPFRVVSTVDATVVVQIERKQERLSCERVVGAPAVGELMKKEVLQDEKHGVQNKHVDDELTAKSSNSAQDKKNTSSTGYWITRAKMGDGS